MQGRGKSDVDTVTQDSQNVQIPLLFNYKISEEIVKPACKNTQTAFWNKIFIQQLTKKISVGALFYNHTFIL